MISASYFLDSRNRLVTDYSFIVSIGALLFSFSKVSNIQSSIEYDTFSEGGNNDYTHVFKKPKQQPDTLILEKGVRKDMTSISFDLLMEGMNIEVLTIMVIDEYFIKKAFFFEKGIIIKRKFSDLDAMGRGLFIASLEIAHTGLIELPI